MNIVNVIYGNSRFSDIARWCLLRLRLYYPYNLYINKKQRSQAPSRQMMEARKVFSDKKRIDAICSFLSDQKSVETFRKLINLRRYYRNRDIPEYNYFNQYFPDDILGFLKRGGIGEVFVDCGAFNGDTAKEFIKRAPNYKRIVEFEPDQRNMDMLRRNLRRHVHITVIQAGISSEDGNAYLQLQENTGGNYVTKESSGQRPLKIKLQKIDSCPQCKDATFIKMDIEGSEMDALKGAKETIQRNHPKLAISIYHSNEDMLKIPEFVHELVPEYELYIRAHTMGIAETVLYAIDRGRQ